MRRKMLAGNWKMNLTPIEARQLIRATPARTSTPKRRRSRATVTCW